MNFYYELLFGTICEKLLQLALHSSPIHDEQYTNEIEVNDLFVHNRFNVVLELRYMFSDNPILLPTSLLTITILNLNIKSIPPKNQFIKKMIMHNRSVKFDVLEFTEIRLDFYFC